MWTGATLDMSFSGLKTAVVNLAHNAQQKGETLDLPALAPDFAAGGQRYAGPPGDGGGTAGWPLRCRWRPPEAWRPTPVIRADLESCLPRPAEIRLIPAAAESLCGDNGAMIGCPGLLRVSGGASGPGMDLNAYATPGHSRKG